MVFLSSVGTISSFFRDANKSLVNELGNAVMLRAIGGLTCDLSYHCEVVDRKIVPIIAECLSRRHLVKITGRLNSFLSKKLDSTLGAQSDITVNLSLLVEKSLYESISSSVFGPSFPLETYYDFHTLDAGLPALLTRTPFAGRAAVKSRTRLLSRIVNYMNDGWKEGDDGEYCIEGASELVTRCARVLKTIGMADSDAAGLVASFMWGLQANVSLVCFWLMAHLLADEEALRRVREEVDCVMTVQFGGLDALLAATPQELEGPGFTIMDSAIKETMRLTVLNSSLREAAGDMEVKTADGQTFFIQKGELVTGDVRGLHLDPTTYRNADVFQVDRFVDCRNQTEHDSDKHSDNHLIAFGRGVHMVSRCHQSYTAHYG